MPMQLYVATRRGVWIATSGADLFIVGALSGG